MSARSSSSPSIDQSAQNRPSLTVHLWPHAALAERTQRWRRKCRRCVHGERVDLDARQNAAAFEDESARGRLDISTHVVTKDVHAWWRRRVTLDLEADAGTTARTAPWRHLGCLDLLKESCRSWIAVLQHPFCKHSLGVGEWPVVGCRAHHASLPECSRWRSSAPGCVPPVRGRIDRNAADPLRKLHRAISTRESGRSIGVVSQLDSLGIDSDRMNFRRPVVARKAKTYPHQPVFVDVENWKRTP